MRIPLGMDGTTNGRGLPVDSAPATCYMTVTDLWRFLSQRVRGMGMKEVRRPRKPWQNLTPSGRAHTAECLNHMVIFNELLARLPTLSDYYNDASYCPTFIWLKVDRLSAVGIAGVGRDGLVRPSLRRRLPHAPGENPRASGKRCPASIRPAQLPGEGFRC